MPKRTAALSRHLQGVCNTKIGTATVRHKIRRQRAHVAAAAYWRPAVLVKYLKRSCSNIPDSEKTRRQRADVAAAANCRPAASEATSSPSGSARLQCAVCGSSKGRHSTVDGTSGDDGLPYSTPYSGRMEVSQNLQRCRMLTMIIDWTHSHDRTPTDDSDARMAILQCI